MLGQRGAQGIADRVSVGDHHLLGDVITTIGEPADDEGPVRSSYTPAAARVEAMMTRAERVTAEFFPPGFPILPFYRLLCAAP